MYYVIYNSKSKNSTNNDRIEEIKKSFEGEVKALDVLTLDYNKLFGILNKEDVCVLVGGDGTLNHFINDVDVDKDLPCKFYFFSNGTGNDFLNDVMDTKHKPDDKGLVLLNDVVKNLPKVTVKGKTYRFINGVGFGIDGYCCEKGDELQAKSDKPVNYASIAISGLLFHYKAPNAKVIVDGVEKCYKKAYIAPTMKGRYYGGGMIVAPTQDRDDPEKEVSFVILHGTNRIKALMIFPKIFKGEHVKYTKNVEIIKGKHVKVEFDNPTALQIDGETISGVLEYEVEI